MEYKYAGKEYTLRLGDDGKIECPDLSTSYETVEEAKAAIREQAEKEKSLPRVTVLFFNDYRRITGFIEGTSTLKLAEKSRFGGSGMIWVSHKDLRGKVERKKSSVSYIFKDTPENREKINKIVSLGTQIAKLEDEMSDVRESLECVEPIEL
jgi:hypothetical protein